MPSQLSFLSNLPVAKFLFLCAEIFLLHLLQHSTIHCSPRGEGNSVGRILNLSRQLVANRQLILGQYTDPPPPPGAKTKSDHLLVRGYKGRTCALALSHCGLLVSERKSIG